MATNKSILSIKLLLIDNNFLYDYNFTFDQRHSMTIEKVIVHENKKTKIEENFKH